MYPPLRQQFNAAFTSEAYAALVRAVNETERWPTDFRVSETPIFLTVEFAEEVTRAGHQILAQLRTLEFARHAQTAIPPGLEVPNETPHPLFIQIDFAICEDPADPSRLIPQLIELQGFPSLYAFQPFVLRCMRDAFPAIPADWTPFFSGLNPESYFDLLQKAVLRNHSPEDVILMEIDPHLQKTRIDFACTERLLGVRPVSVDTIKRRGKSLFYERDGNEVRISRIYNRLIFDELLRRPDLKLDFRLQDELDVEWAGHPNWYFRISKHSLPFLKTEHTSPAWFADEFPESESLEDYVLKPLYSFAGLGVDIEPTREKLSAIDDPPHMDFAKESEVRGICSDGGWKSIQGGNSPDVYLARRGRTRAGQQSCADEPGKNDGGSISTRKRRGSVRVLD